MSSLTDIEKRYFESLLGMASGYVLDYNDQKFGEFFKRHKIEIHSTKYQSYGSSKARKLRSFWEQESDAVVSRVLAELLDTYEGVCALEGKKADTNLLDKSRAIIARLAGESTSIQTSSVQTIDDFLHSEFTIPNIQKLPIEAQAIPIIESRLKEARTAIAAGAYLSTIFLCGSVLEAVLLGAAQKEPARFNRAASSPKGPDGTARRFHEWSLSQLIDASSEIGLLKPDVKKFSHGLRDFRNYIHPYEQMASGFSPDQHTAKVCFQVLKAALASIAGDR